MPPLVPQISPFAPYAAVGEDERLQGIEGKDCLMKALKVRTFVQGTAGEDLLRKAFKMKTFD